MRTKLVERLEEFPEIKNVFVDDLEIAKDLLVPMQERRPGTNFLLFRANMDVYTSPCSWKRLVSKSIQYENELNRLCPEKGQFSSGYERFYSEIDLDTALNLTILAEGLPKEIDIDYVELERKGFLGFGRRVVEKKKRKKALRLFDRCVLRQMFYDSFVPYPIQVAADYSVPDYIQDIGGFTLHHTRLHDTHVGNFWAGVFAITDNPLGFIEPSGNIVRGEGGFGGISYRIPKIVIYHPSSENIFRCVSDIDKGRIAFVNRDKSVVLNNC